MALLDIRLYGDPMLREKAQPIEEITDEHRRLAEDMAETMYEASGIGLAATQVGRLVRLIVVDVNWARAENPETEPKRPKAMINPEILKESAEDDEYQEGCLSLPGIEGEVWRSVQIKVRYTTLDGETVEQECEDLHARCILHEIDHLDGTLFIDRMSPAGRKELDRPLRLLAQSASGDAQAEDEA